MSEASSQWFEKLTRLLAQENVIVSAAEMHGMLTGLVASSAPSKERDWLLALSDLTNEGEKFSAPLLNELEALHTHTVTGLECPDLSFQMVLPSDDEPLEDRVVALTEWTQCFLVGFGIHQQNLAKASDDLKEAIQDMAEISKLSSDVLSGEEDERAFYEVSEYVRITAIMCFNELSGVSTPVAPVNQTIH
ncbi:UPF0149 family protein [Aliidiomarina halalkaliphila]|uniref:UPF0149 family protein n=1 Tax=Aliidiomarina halalkaliphila TaxID=2593535 RepID=A0A552WZR9_9GAMM|nr:UPF0149 family protein [Aliidiomarina halalkaliphila]TRW48079.1 UPF0149 family protein [Aliidiomarina halalkaliphila]